MGRNRKMPAHSVVRDTWAADLGLPLDGWVCFACRRPVRHHGRLDRAHIVPVWRGGTDEARNLHLLCRGCHRDSEGMEEQDYREFLGGRDILDGVLATIIWAGKRSRSAKALSEISKSGIPPKGGECRAEVCRVLGNALQSFSEWPLSDQWNEVDDMDEEV